MQMRYNLNFPYCDKGSRPRIVMRAVNDKLSTLLFQIYDCTLDYNLKRADANL